MSIEPVAYVGKAEFRKFGQARKGTREAESMVELKIVDVTDRKSIECPNCRFTIDIPPRTVSIEKLRHMYAVKRFAEWQKNLGLQGLANVRVLLCPRCGEPTICTDRFSVKV